MVEHRDGDEMLEVHTDTPTGNCSDPIATPSFSGESQLITCEAAKFILKTLEGKKLTQSVTDDIIVDTNIFVECVVWDTCWNYESITNDGIMNLFFTKNFTENKINFTVFFTTEIWNYTVVLHG